ncbi:hypothetical protein DPEC_G00196440 [Dallia pectoralis]|uniref:Uncharacterized protein n=1 Tax=Dallia pectoralis TaxID=75939 RepID=A0ACC2G7L8_DALPE|nr:hypothetical protein DPEC_G00196440 [Dallia pectoralis]
MYTFGHDNHEAAEEIEDEIFDSQGSRSKIKDLILKRIPLTAYPGTGSSVWKSTRGVAACLGLLSILLMAGVIGLVVYYNREMDSFKENINLIGSRSKTKDFIPQRTLTAYPGTGSSGRKSTRGVAACLGLLSILLMAGVIGLVVYYNREMDSFKEKINLIKTWEDSRRDCEEKNADLLIIKSREEQVYLHGLNNEVFWIGLTDKKHEGKWMWVDGTELTTGYWAGGQPDNRNNMDEDCAARWSGESNPEKSWHDAPCNELHYWMCEEKFQL